MTAEIPRRHGLASVALGVLAVAFAVGALVSAVLRVRYGVDFKDEAYYVALAYRFALGDRPFVDEMSIMQLAALMTFPFVKAWVAVTGSSDGVVLFTRWLWVAFSVAVGAAGFAFLRRLMRWPLALLAATLPLLAAPYNIPNLSYNSLGVGLLALGMALGALAVVCERSRWWLLAAGVAHGLAVVAYPTLAIAVIGWGVALVAVYRREVPRPLAAYAGGALAVGLALGALFLAAGVDNVLIAWRYMDSLAGYAGGGSKLVTISTRFVLFMLDQPAFLVMLLVTFAAFVAFRDRARWLLLLLPVAIFPVTFRQPYTLGNFALLLFGLIGVWLILFTAEDPRARRIYAWAVLPSLVASLVMSYTSTNGIWNSGVGFFPALFATPAMLAAAVSPLVARPGRAAALVPWAFAAALVVFALGLGWYQWRTVYHTDEPLSQLTAVVDDGPFRGLRCTPSTAQADRELRADVDRWVTPGERVLFFDHFPAGYLYTAARPAANTLWLSASDNRVGREHNATLAYWRRTGNRPDIAFRYTFRTPYESGHVVRDAIMPPAYALRAQRGRYEVWVRVGE